MNPEESSVYLPSRPTFIHILPTHPWTPTGTWEEEEWLQLTIHCTVERIFLFLEKSHIYIHWHSPSIPHILKNFPFNSGNSKVLSIYRALNSVHNSFSLGYHGKLCSRPRESVIPSTRRWNSTHHCRVTSPAPIDTGVGHATCCGQWVISRRNILRVLSEPLTTVWLAFVLFPWHFQPEL